MDDAPPAHLSSTAQLIERAYPQGVPPGDYLPLLAVLAEHLCEENLALLAERWSPQRSGSRLNDVLAAKAWKGDRTTVHQRLLEAGLETWADED